MKLTAVLLLVILSFALTQDVQSISCIKKCVRKHLKWTTALKVIAKCKLNKGCYLRSVGGKAKNCVLGCIGKSEPQQFKAVSQEDDIHNAIVDATFEKEVSTMKEGTEKNILKCMKNCVKKHLSWIKAIRLIAKCKLKKDCYLRSVKGKAKECVKSCLGKAEPVAYKKVEQKQMATGTEKNILKCMKNCVKKHLSWMTAVRLIAKCKLNKDCYLRSVKGKAKECVKSCLDSSELKNFSATTVEGTCVNILVQKRKEFRSLETKKEQVEMVKKAYKYLREKYPDVEKRKVVRFLGLAFSKKCPAFVCKVFKTFFQFHPQEIDMIANSIIEQAQ